jgi:ankyrin repeat protein
VVRADTDDNLSAIVERLLDEGCDVNAKNDNGCTPLHSYLSNKEGKGSIVRLLLSRGANINILRMLMNAGAKAQMDEIFEVALSMRDKDIVQLLRDSGAVELDESLGLDELMTESVYQVSAFEEVQATAGADHVES